MLDWYSRRIPLGSRNLSDMLTLIMQETLTNAGLQRVYVYTVSSTGELRSILQSTVALSTTGHDGGYEGGNMISRVAQLLGD